jgi:hypothetical protein
MNRPKKDTCPKLVLLLISGKYASDRRQRLIEVGDDVFHVLDAD